LHQNIEDIPVLIHRPPQIVAFAANGEKDLVQMPLVTRLRAPTAELMGIRLAELPAPLPDGFIGHNDAPGEQPLFDIAIAETEAEVQPDAMADDLNWEAVVLVPISRWWAHGVSIAHQVSIGQATQQVDKAARNRVASMTWVALPRLKATFGKGG
jgi:hypothetical protein